MHLRFMHYDKLNRKKYHWNVFRAEHQLSDVIPILKQKTKQTLFMITDNYNF